LDDALDTLEERRVVVMRLLIVVTLALVLSALLTPPVSARGSLEALVQISDPTTSVPIPEDNVVAKDRSWNPNDLPVTFDELVVASAAVVTTFAAAAGSIALFVPPEAQLAVFSGLIFIAATPIDGLIIGGGAIAAYRYFRGDQSAAEPEAFAPSWIDRWTYSPN
jgi:hypothetical protein